MRSDWTQAEINAESDTEKPSFNGKMRRIVGAGGGREGHP